MKRNMLEAALLTFLKYKKKKEMEIKMFQPTLLTFLKYKKRIKNNKENSTIKYSAIIPVNFYYYLSICYCVLSLNIIFPTSVFRNYSIKMFQ